MFRDRQQELERLAQQLLEEEAEEESEEESEFDEPGLEGEPEYDPDRIYNNDNTDLDPDALSEDVLYPKKRSMTGVLVFVLLLTAAILGLLAWMLVRLEG